MNLLQMNNGHKAFGAHNIFTNAVFSINADEHVGVIGPNGAGKTTLFKILNHEQELDDGNLTFSNSLSLGYLSQHDQWSPGETGNSYLERVSKLPLWEVKSRGRDLMVTEEIFAKPISSLSGGYRMRIKLIGLLGSDPNLMLLDEPTNYLDLETTLLLERFLQNFKGAFLLISHDREFLRRTTDHILEVEGGEITKYNGNIDDYFEQKELLKTQLEARAQNQAEKRKALLDFITRFGAKATKAKQAQSRMKTLEKMETIELKAIPVTATIRIPAPPHVGKSVIKMSNCHFGYENRTIIENVNIEIKRGDHVAVVGLNGAGKSTLLKGLAGTLAPLSGERELGYQVQLAIFNQHVVEVLNPSHTVFESLEEGAGSGVDQQDIRNMAGSLLFTDEQIHKKISVLSGGEKSRVALARILLQRVPFLLLDEPTNHLDFQTVEALTTALKAYEGTLAVVSHDRGFIRRVATQILEVSNGQVNQYPGTYDEYVWKLQRELTSEIEILPTEKTVVESTPVKFGLQKKENDKKLRAVEKNIKLIEAELTRLESENIELNNKISSPSDSDRANASDLIARLAANSQRVQEIESQWLELQEQLQKLSNQFQ